MDMSSRIALSRRCILLKKVPDDVDEKCLSQCISGVKHCHRHNEFSLDKPETRWIVRLTTIEAAEKLIKNEEVSVTTSDGKERKLRVGGCPECIIPENWIENGTPETFDLTMFDSIGMASFRRKEEEQNDYKPDEPVGRELCSSMLKGSDIYEKVEKPEEKNPDKYVPPFEIPPISSPFSPKWSTTDDQHIYNSVNEEKTDDPQTYKVGPVVKPDNQVPSSNSHQRSMVDDFHPYNSVKEEEDIGVTTSRSNNEPQTFNVGPSKKPEHHKDDEDPYNTIDDLKLKSYIASGGDTPPPLPKRLGWISNENEPSLSTYMEPVSVKKMDSQQPASTSKDDASTVSVLNSPNTGYENAEKLSIIHSGDNNHLKPVAESPTLTAPESASQEKGKQEVDNVDKEGNDAVYQNLESFKRTENSYAPLAVRSTKTEAEPIPFIGASPLQTGSTSQQPPLQTGFMLPSPGAGGFVENSSNPQNHLQGINAMGLQNQPNVNFAMGNLYPVLHGTPFFPVSQLPEFGISDPSRGDKMVMQHPLTTRMTMPHPQMAGMAMPHPQMAGMAMPYPQMPGMAMPQPQMPGMDMPQPRMSGMDMPQPRMSGMDMPHPQMSGIDMPQPQIGVMPPKPDSKEEIETGRTRQKTSPRKKKPNKSASPRKEDSSNDKSVETEGSFKTIKVKLTQPLSKDTIENYFENKRKSGGGDIESCTITRGNEEEVQEALITFSASTAAKNCLQQKHIVSNTTITVQKYDPSDPSLWDMDKAFVTGLNPTTSEETLMDFLEPVAGVAPIKVQHGGQKDLAVVVFSGKPDFDAMSKRCKKKTLDGSTLSIQMVEKCNAVCVTGINKTITVDTVDNFFCNKRRSGGGEVETVDYKPQDGYCIVYYVNPSDAENVAARGSFIINEKEISVQLFYPCLGFSEEPINWDEMPSVDYQCNGHILKFLKNCKTESDQIEKTLLKNYVHLIWPKSKSGNCVKMQCTITEKVENAKEILKTWQEIAEKEMEKLIERYVVQKHTILKEAWPNVLDQLKTLNIDHPEKVAVLTEKKNCTVIVVGYEENAEALTRKILGLLTAEEMKIQNQAQMIMKNVPLDFHKCQQLWKTHFGKKIKTDFPDVECQIEIDKKEVNFSGKISDVHEAMIKMHEYLMSTKSKSLKISKGRYQIFTAKTVKERFIEELKGKGNKAVWNVTEDKVEMTSSNKKTVDEALEIFQEFIPEKHIKVKELIKVLTTHEWQGCVKELRDRYKEKVNVASSSSEVCVTATKDVFETVYKQVDSVLRTCSEKCSIDKKVVTLSKQQFSYMKYYGKNEIVKIKNAGGLGNLEVTENPALNTIEITGNVEEVKAAEEELMRFVRRLTEDTFNVSKPGAKAFFGSGKGREALKKTGKETSCIIVNRETLRNDQGNRASGGHRGARLEKPKKVAECQLQPLDKKFIVMNGDVTKLTVDVIVNAANEDLDHCGGLALAISRAGGKSIQEESKSYVLSHGKVIDGEAVSAPSPGRLPCKLLVHAVGPRWQGGNKEEEIKLRKAILKCLELADKDKFSSIAVPALSAGIFCYPVDQSVDTILSAIEFYFKNCREGKSSKIKEIYFCDIDDNILRAFIRCLKKKYGQDVKEIDVEEEVHQSSYPDEDIENEPEMHRRSDAKSKIKVISGELARMKVDVIVNSTDKSLDLSLGAISRSLLRAAGDSIQNECRLNHRNGIQPGEVVITKGGNLQCTQVYHGAIKRWDNGKGDALDVFKNFVDKCLHLASKNMMRSIAFPAIGTGRLGYSSELAANTMLNCCQNFLSGNESSSLEEIFFVIYDRDREILQAFQTVLKSGGVSRAAGATTPRYPRRTERGSGSHDKSFKLNKLSIEIRQGDITNERTDVIVNSITDNLNLSYGAASKAILKAAGDSIQKECSRGGISLSNDGYVVTSGGKMYCKHIIHVKTQKTADGWENVVTKALAHADKIGCQSIAFPALGTGVRGVDPADNAKAMFRAMRKCFPKNLQTVRVIIFQKDMVTVFLSTLKSTPQGPLNQVKDYVSGKIKEFGFDQDDGDSSSGSKHSHHSRRDHGSHSNHSNREYSQPPVEDRVTFLILSDTDRNIKKAKDSLDNVYQCKEIEYSRNTLANYQVEEIKKIAKEVDVVFTEKKLLLMGHGYEVSEAAVAILSFLHKVKDKEKAQAIYKYVKWQYETSQDKWLNFRDEVNLQIETAYHAKEKSCVVKDRTGTEYVIDFKNMEEYEKNNRHKKCKIQRLDKGERGSSSVGLPSKWKPMKSDQTMMEVTLRQGDKEYNDVLSHFQTSAGGSVKVSEIRRVQNPSLYQQYAAKRKEISLRNGKDPEKWLWHGTHPDTVNKIINNGFNRSYCGRNGTSYGAGVYFAVNASYSLGYCCQDSKGLKHMFAVQVATGDTCQGGGYMQFLPPKHGAGSHVTYDSASDNPANPVMFVIFHDSQAYPTYHIFLIK
uniref:Poly [ADP-ribose] polymerase n=1 Tax=Crassostrea virginica TaxID=6565 RepID=A0A8B8E811_CRAVI|nr:poly [ADP-ribose] polymerase 14-like isoform X3 [Crassostrea virginica]